MNDIDIDIEKKLAENGFTSKDILAAKELILQENKTLNEIMIQWRRIFWGGICIRILLLFMFLTNAFYKDFPYFVANLLAFGFAFIMTEFFASVKFGAKVIRFIKKYGVN